MGDPTPTRRSTWHVEFVEETGSTNDDLLVAAAAGAPERSVLRTAHQTAGRGRLDRRWDAPPGANLLVSILFREGSDRPHRLTQRVAVAAAIAVERASPVRPVLKWPNDLMVDGRKLAGILAQAGGAGNRVDHVVVGLGLNVGWAPPGAARLGDGIQPAVVLDALLAALDELGDAHDDEYRDRLATLGSQVEVHRTDGVVRGTAVDVLADGRLVVVVTTPNGVDERLVLDTGDVIHLRPVAD